MDALLFFLVVTTAMLWALWRAMPIFSKPWRVKVVKGRNFSNTVDVILAKRCTLGNYASDKIIIASDIRVNSDDLDEKLNEALKRAKEHAQTLKKTKKMNHSWPTMPRRKDPSDAN